MSSPGNNKKIIKTNLNIWYIASPTNWSCNVKDLLYRKAPCEMSRMQPRQPMWATLQEPQGLQLQLKVLNK